MANRPSSWFPVEIAFLSRPELNTQGGRLGWLYLRMAAEAFQRRSEVLVFPSPASLTLWLQAMTGLGRQTVAAMLRELQDANLVERVSPRCIRLPNLSVKFRDFQQWKNLDPHVLPTSNGGRARRYRYAVADTISDNVGRSSKLAAEQELRDAAGPESSKVSYNVGRSSDNDVDKSGELLITRDDEGGYPHCQNRNVCSVVPLQSGKPLLQPASEAGENRKLDKSSNDIHTIENRNGSTIGLKEDAANRTPTGEEQAAIAELRQRLRSPWKDKAKLLRDEIAKRSRTYESEQAVRASAKAVELSERPSVEDIASILAEGVAALLVILRVYPDVSLSEARAVEGVGVAVLAAGLGLGVAGRLPWEQVVNLLGEPDEEYLRRAEAQFGE